MVKFFQFLTITLFFSLGTINAAKSASFDCNKASTTIEVSICNTPALSHLDEEMSEIFSSLDKNSRYFEIIKKSQLHWISHVREASEESFENRIDFLLFAKELNNCIKNKILSACIKNIDPIFDSCLSRGNYTTMVMNSCGSIYIHVLEIIEAFETELRQEYIGDDHQSIVGFNDAYLKWKEYIKADCKWQYDEYRDGTIRGLIWASCMMSHYEQRITSFNSQNSYLEKQ